MNCTHLHSIRHCAILFLAVLLLPYVGAFSITAPTSVAENHPIDVTLSGIGTLTIEINGQQVATGTGTIQHTLTTNYSAAGLYGYQFTAADGNESRLIEVTNVPLTLTVLAPTTTELTTNSVLFSVQTNLPAELCWVTIDGNSNTLDATSTTTFEKTLSVVEGIHNLVFKCTLAGETTEVQRTLLIDTTPPAITSTSPSGDQIGPFITLTANTDEIAQCNYGQSDAPYSSLPHSMGGTFALQSATTIELSTQGPQTYFVRCRDVHGNAMTTSSVISFALRVAPAAEISVEGDEPFEAGTYDITLNTNVDLATTPTLKYTFQESGVTKDIGLTGDDDKWTGFLIIPEDVSDSVLSFQFSGESKQGVTGTSITKGALLELDAIAPDPIESITIENTSVGLKLTWFVKDPEDDATYNIYRADHENVDYIDFYTSTGTLSYTDYDATGAQFYYYRVAPVDKARNIGELSPTVYGSVINEQLSDPFLEVRLEEQQYALETAILDADTSIAELERESNQFQVQIIEDMHLLTKAQTAREQLQATLTRLQETLRTPEAVDRAIAEAQETIDTAKANLVSRIVPQTQTETKQLVDLDGLARNIPYIAGDNHETQLAAATTLQNEMTVSLYAHSFTIWDLYNVGRKYTFVRKKIHLDEPKNDVTLLEALPKVDAAVTFEQIPGETNPARYFFPVLEDTTLTYIYDDIISLDLVKQSRTFAYPKPQQQDVPLVTGYATKETGTSTDMILIVAGIVIILGLVVYYVSLSVPKTEFHGFPVQAAQPVQQVRAQPRRIVRTKPTKRQEDPKTVLSCAEQHIDAKEYDTALQLYKDCLNALDDTARKTLQEDTTRVYKKLMLYKHLSDVHTAIEEKNVQHIRTALSDAKTLAKEIGDQETQLIKDAKNAFKTFVQLLNKLEIERMAKY